MFRKISAIYSLVFTAWLYFHMIFSLLYVLRAPGTSMDASMNIATISLIGVIIHGVLSIITFFFFKGIDYCKKGRFYRIRTFIQVFSTIIIIALLFIHIDSDQDYSDVSIIIKAVTAYAFIISVLLHICFSVGKAFKDVGIVKTDRGVEITSRVFYIINGALILSITYLMMFTAISY